MRQHDSQLAYHVLLYAIQALSEGDLAAINDLDFTAAEVNQLSQLTGKALRHFAKLSGHFLTIKTDHECFAKMMARLQNQLEQEAYIDALIQHEAPITMMIHLFGISSAEYIQRQKLLGVPQRGAGRPAALDDDTQIEVWHKWKATEALPAIERYLAVSRETGLPLRSLWSLIQSWETDTDRSVG